jgi:hypothetical protein
MISIIFYDTAFMIQPHQIYNNEIQYRAHAMVQGSAAIR